MGAGKSTVGRILAARLHWQFYDVDRVIEAQQNELVPALFAKLGEAAFRGFERQAIEGLHQKDQTVISLGGGAVETAGIRELLFAAPDSMVVFLQAPLQLLLDRCLAQDGGESRPVLLQPDELEARYNLRVTYYQNAHLTVLTESLTPENVAAAIVDHLAAQHYGHYASILANDQASAG